MELDDIREFKVSSDYSNLKIWWWLITNWYSKVVASALHLSCYWTVSYKGSIQWWTSLSILKKEKDVENFTKEFLVAGTKSALDANIIIDDVNQSRYANILIQQLV